MENPIQSSSLVCAAPVSEVVACQLVNETALLNLSSGIYYSLDEVGASLWELITQPIKVGDIHRALLKKYDVESARLENDILNLLTHMAAARLVVITESEISK